MELWIDIKDISETVDGHFSPTSIETIHPISQPFYTAEIQWERYFQSSLCKVIITSQIIIVILFIRGRTILAVTHLSKPIKMASRNLRTIHPSH